MRFKKKLATLMALAVMFTSIPAMNVSAAKIGDKLGNVMNSDIKAYINGKRIPCYNVNNQTAVIVGDLANYGFDVKWDGVTRTSNVTINKNKAATPLIVSDTTAQPGSVAFPYVYTDVRAFINGQAVESFNINGSLVVYFSALKVFGESQWDAVKRTTTLTTKPAGQQIGDKLGDVLSTDIEAYINEESIPCMNINGQVAINVSDLKNYGFDVTWNGTNRTSTITLNAKKEMSPMSGNMDKSEGNVIGSYVYTDIAAVINGKKVASFNVNGELVVYFSALAPFGESTWDGSNRASMLYTSYSVGGKVTDEHSGSGIGGATITLTNSAGKTTTVKTSSSGMYSFANVAKGTYNVSATADGYMAGKQSVSVSKTTSNIDFDLEVGVFSLLGKITDGTTKVGIPDATVELKNTRTGETMTDMTTSVGVYSFSDVMQGTYTITVEAENYPTSKTTSFVVSNNITNKNITLKRTIYSVTGKISGATSSVYREASVDLINSTTGKVIDTVEPSSNGTYTFTTVPAGSYEISVYADGYEEYTSSKFSVSANVTGKNVTLKKDGITVTGRVIGSDNSSGLAAYVVIKTNDSYKQTVTYQYADYSGYYTFEGIQAGNYIIEVTMSGYVTQTSTFTANNDVTKNFTMQKGGNTVTGRVTARTSGTSLPATIKIINYSNSSSYYSANANSDGTYSIQNVPAGYYNFEVTYPGYAKGTLSYIEVSSSYATTKDFALEVGGVTLSGQVTSVAAGSAGLNGAVVDVVNSSGTVIASATSSAPYGYYTIYNIPEGTYVVKARLLGYTDYTSSSMTISGTSGMNYQITLNGNTKTIVGTVKKGTTMIVGATVTIKNLNTNTQVASVTTVAGGAYSFTNMQSGVPYLITATFTENSVTSTQDTTMPANDTTGSVPVIILQ